MRGRRDHQGGVILFDPNKKFSIEEAEMALGLEEDDRMGLRMVFIVDLLCAHIGITDEQIKMAYEQKLKAHLNEAADALKKLADD